MVTANDAKTMAAAAYDAAADSYDHPTNSFWDRFGRRTVDRLPLFPGASVLDVCCGSGASAIPAAEKVGPEGEVLGIDVAENLLQLARRKAGKRGLTNVEFRVGDLLDSDMPDAEFDSVICVFGIFFVPDMPAAVRELWRLVRPNGHLALTTWGPRLFEPANSLFWEVIREVRPDLHKGFNPWDRICEPESIRSMLAEGGVHALDITAESGSHKISTPDDFWQIVMGSGYRGTVEKLSTKDRDYVREQTISRVHRDGLRELEANVVYALATKADE